MFRGTEDSKKSDRTKAREAFFIEFAKAIRSRFPQVPLIVTGGFRSRLGMEAALEQGGCDLVGIGRPAVLNPHLPKNTIFNKEIKDEDAKLYARRIEPSWLGKLAPPAIGAGAESVSLSLPRFRMFWSWTKADLVSTTVLVQRADGLHD